MALPSIPTASPSITTTSPSIPTASGIRIVLMLSFKTDAWTAALLAWQEAMTNGYAWLLSEEWAAVTDMVGWLWFRPFLPSATMQLFAKQVSDYSKSHFNITVRPDLVDLTHSTKLYDAVMLYAYSATKVISEGGNLRNGQAVTAAVRNTTIEGVGDTVVALDSNGDRVESYEVMNYVVEAGDVLSSVAVGIFDATLKEYKAYEQALVWPGNTKDVPVDFVSGALFWIAMWPVAFNGML